MNRLRKWGVNLVVAIATFLSVMTIGLLGWQTVTPAQLSQAPDIPAAPPTLESAGLTLEELGEGVYGLIASTDFPPADFTSLAICNGAFIIGTDSVLVTDPFQTEDLANLLFETVESITDLPIRYVVNTHYHFDHTGGNAAAAERELPILGRGPIREWMTTRNLELDPEPTPPTVVMSSMGDIWLGDRHVLIQDMEGHSGGTDIIVYVPDVDVLIAGDLLFNERIPYLVDGDIPLWQDTLDVLMTTYSTATVLPGHGLVTTVEGLETQKAYVDYLEATALEWKAAEISQEEAIATTTVPPEYADYLFQALFPGNLEVAYQQITLGQAPEETALRISPDLPNVRGL